MVEEKSVEDLQIGDSIEQEGWIQVKIKQSVTMTEEGAEYSPVELRPLGSRVVIRPDSQKDKTAGGIYLPDQAKEEPTEGVITNCGPGHQLKNGEYAPLEVQSGQRVIFNKWGATEFKEDGQTLVIVREEDILGIIHGGEIDDELLPAF